MKTTDFDYELPESSIAYQPPAKRGTSNLLVIDSRNLTEENISSHIEIAKYSDLDNFLEPRDLIILNETKVMPARLVCEVLGEIHPEVEIFLLEKHANNAINKAICRGKIREGMNLRIKDTDKLLEVTRKDNEFVELAFLNFNRDDLENIAHTPIPPYLKRQDSDADRIRYQTIFANSAGSVAAPTASLNMTEELFSKFQENSIKYDFLTLHCGYGTFKPITTNDVERHDMHSEYFEIRRDLAEKLLEKQQDRNIVAVGTTVTRTLEYLKRMDIDSLSHNSGSYINGESDIFIYPGFEFKIVDKLLTNFHAPRSTPLLLVNAFLISKLSRSSEISLDTISSGIRVMKSIYNYALCNDFKFLSYGDSMLIL